MPIIGDLPTIPVLLNGGGRSAPGLAPGVSSGRNAEVARDVAGAGRLDGSPDACGRIGGDAGGDEDVGAVRPASTPFR